MKIFIRLKIDDSYMYPILWTFASLGQWVFLKANELLFGQNRRRIEVVLIAKFLPIWPKKTPHAKMNHESVQVSLPNDVYFSAK